MLERQLLPLSFEQITQNASRMAEQAQENGTHCQCCRGKSNPLNIGPVLAGEELFVIRPISDPTSQAALEIVEPPCDDTCQPTEQSVCIAFEGSAILRSDAAKLLDEEGIKEVIKGRSDKSSAAEVLVRKYGIQVIFSMVKRLIDDGAFWSTNPARVTAESMSYVLGGHLIY